eukprot:TRINITY_DN29670_c0_g1_i1.p1 TRINITY_DN29670_c0_g1~~TRINITY_DN29670_c0_g1_i1.p1  ORF type:complete len:452 (-),score=123.17 TRINITY_DN29670_c0_g1_i1:73-1428(-)
MSVADLKRLVQRATPRVEDVRSPDRTDIIRREHGHLPFREVVDALDALEFSATSFARTFRQLLAAEEEKTSSEEEQLCSDTAVHSLFNLLDGLRVLCPAHPAAATAAAAESEGDEEWATSSTPGWQEVAAVAKANGAESLKQKDIAAAITHYSAAINATPKGEGDLHVLFSNRSAARLQAGDAEAALKDARTCVRLAPSWPKGRFREGCCLRQLGRLEEAAVAFAAGQKLEPENKDWGKEVDKTDKLLEAKPAQLVRQVVLGLLPDILAAWYRSDVQEAVLQLQVNGQLSELGACKWRLVREGAKTAKAQIRFAVLQKKGYLANLAANLQNSSPEGYAVADLEGRPLKIPDVSGFLAGEARAAIHLDIKDGKDGKMKAVLLTLPLDDALQRFIVKPKDPDAPKGAVDSVLGLQKKSGFPKSYPRYLGFQNFPGDLNFPVIDLLRDAPGSIE